MANRPNQLAGLAALGALGYIMSQKGQKNEAPVETRSFSPNPAPSAAPTRSAEPAMQSITAAEGAGEQFDVPPQAARARTNAVPTRSVTPTRLAPIAAPDVSDAYPDESRRGRMTSAPETIAASAAPRMSPAAMAQSTTRMPGTPESVSVIKRSRGPQAGEEEAYRAAQAAARSAAPASSAASRPVSAVDQIPTDSALYRNVTDGERVSGNELTRNVGNTLAALTPLGGGFGKVGAELMTAKGAAQRAEKARELAEAARRAKPATTLKSTPSTAPARANQAAKSGRKKFNEDEEGVVFKRGGMTKKMASGGMSVSKASSRADGIAQRGKTRGKLY